MLTFSCLGGRPGGDDPSITSTDALPLAPDVWDLETLRRGLDDARSTGQAVLPPTNSEADFYIGDDGPGDSGDNIYAGSGGGLDGNGDDLYDSRGGSHNDASSVRGALNGLDGPLLSGGDLADAGSAIQPFSTAQATTRSQSRTLRSRPITQRSSALPPPLALLPSRASEPRSSRDAVAPPGPSYDSTVHDDEASAQEPLSPLSPLREEWLDGQSLFVSDAENEGTDTAEDEASYSSADEREHTIPRPRRAYVPKGVYTRGVHGRDYAPSVNESKYGTAAAWLRAQMLEEPVCSTCSSDLGSAAREDGFSLAEVADHIRGLGVPDALAGSEPPTEDGRPWQEALSGGAERPHLNMAKSHRLDPEPAARFDVDAFIAEATSLEALRGLRFSYYPRPNRNLSKPIHVWFHGRRLHLCRHIRFGEAIHAQDIEVYVGFPNLPLVKETYLTEEQHALWIDGVVLPSLRSVLPRTSMQHFPATWAIGASKMRAKHNEHRTWDVGGTNAIHYAVKEAFMPGLWEAMLATVSDPRLSIFRGMFIVLQTYGTKLVWNDSCFSTLRTNVLTDLDKSINREYLVREKTYFDVGKETVLALGRIQW